MDKKYNELFTLIARTTANVAEQVMDLHKANNEEKQYTTAQSMRDDFMTLHDKLVEGQLLTKADYARLLVGSIIVVNQIDSRIKNDQQALRAYKIDLIPKLDQINNADTEEEGLALAEKLFLIKEELPEEDEDEEE